LVPVPVEASDDDGPEPVLPEAPEAIDADVTGAIVVVVAGTVVVVDVVDVVVELEVVVEEEVVVVVVVVVEEVESAPAVAVQQVLNVCALPGATALTPVLSTAVA
jgi:hypothetical protein